MSWPTSAVVTGDLVTAAQLNRLPIILAEANGAAASYDFTSIPAGWTHLRIEACLQGNSGNGSDQLRVVLNNDSGANYTWYYRDFQAAVENNARASGRIDCARVPGKNTGSFAAVTILITNYDVAIAHSIHAVSHAVYANVNAADQMLTLGGGGHLSAVAINRITLSLSAGSFVANSTATIYGLGQL